MDRNVDPDADTLTDDVVALRKESVDRNFHAMQIVIVKMQSLSARRAWIEMLVYLALIRYLMSLSARRAWIEMSCCVVLLSR